MCAIVLLQKCYAESKMYKHTCNAKISHSTYLIKHQPARSNIWTGQKVKEIIYGRTHPGFSLAAWHLAWLGILSFAGKMKSSAFSLQPSAAEFVCTVRCALLLVVLLVTL